MPIYKTHGGGGQAANFTKRTVGMFTGSRSAAAAGRIPLLDIATLRLRHWQQFGLTFKGCSLGLATFVDNLFAIAPTPEAATYILDDCARLLLSRWGLKIGGDSKEYMTCKAYTKPITVQAGWERKSSMRVLGHFLDDDGSIKTCSDHAFAAMTKAFYSNFKPGLHKSSKAVKLKFLRTCVCTVARFRWSRWPFTRTNADKLDALQRRFLYSLFPMSPRSHEPIQDFYTRRHRAASIIAGSSGKWSQLWASDLNNWDAHVHRKHDPHAWSHHLLSWRGSEWINFQRFWNSAVGESRTNTRVFRGAVHRRWEEGLVNARHH